MQPAVTVAEMAAFDALAIEATSRDDLVEAAGRAVAREVAERFGPMIGRRIVVVAGKGSNGADGRVAARLLAAEGAEVTIVEPSVSTQDLVGAELVIDAAYGTGLARTFEAPMPPPSAIVVAVDLPSGVDADTGAVAGRAMAASVTVTMAARKVGLLLGEGRRISGEVVVADIGIAVHDTVSRLVGDEDLELLPRRGTDSHKWTTPVTVVAGAPGMEGAGALACLGAMRAGAGMVRLIHPITSGSASVAWPLELVRRPVPMEALALATQEETARSGALVVGPGLGSTPQAHAAVRQLLAERCCPVVLDADGLGAVEGVEGLAALVAARPSPVVITPHDGEMRRLLGAAVPGDRIACALDVARRSGATVLLKGPTTIIASSSGGPNSVLLVTSGTEALATAGTGDVLSGVIAALIASGLEPLLAAGLAAHLHGRAGARFSGVLLASELPGLIGELIGEVHHGR